MPRDRWTGHRPLDAAAHGKPVQSGDVIATGRNARELSASLCRALSDACRRHGPDTVEQGLNVVSVTAWEFMGWLQRRECASRNEVAEAGALAAGQCGGGQGIGIPVPASALRDCEVADLLSYIMDHPEGMERFAEWLTFEAGGV